jgi:hypothetical protein
MITNGMPSPYSGTIQPRFNAESTLRAYEQAKRAQPSKVEPGTSYMNPGGVPENVKNALADRGYNPDGTKMSPEAQRAYQTNKLIGQYSQYRSPPSVRTPQNQSLPPGFSADTPISGMPSLADVGQRLYDAAVGTGKAITGALGAGINALANVGVRPGSVVSTDQGLRIVGEDGTLTPYSLERERVVNMMRPDYAYTPPVDPAIGRMPRPAPQYGPMPTPTGEEGITPSSGLAAIPTPVSMGLIAPPRPRPRPENLRPAPPRPVARPSDLMDSYTPRTPSTLNYPGADGITGEDIGGVYGEGDSEGYEGVPGKIGPRSFLNLYSEGLPPGYAERYGLDKERVLEVEDFPEEGVSPADEDRNASPSQGGLTEDQRKKAEKEINRAKPVVRGVTTATGLATGLPFGTVSGFAFNKYKENKLKQLEDYAAMTKAEKRVAEKKNPELVGWANRLGIPSENDYSSYQNWASERGLRAPPSREGGGGGISDIVAGGPSGTSGGTTEPPSTQPPAQSGRRPDIYYMWDLGVNIPSPNDPTYTMYMTYLAERNAAQAAMYR